MVAPIFFMSWYTFQVANSRPLQVANDGVGAQTPTYFGGGLVAHVPFPLIVVRNETTKQMVNDIDLIVLSWIYCPMWV